MNEGTTRLLYLPSGEHLLRKALDRAVAIHCETPGLQAGFTALRTQFCIDDLNERWKKDVDETVLLRLLAAGSPEDVEDIPQLSDKTDDRAGNYVGLMFDRTDPDFIGVYNGSSIRMSYRAKEHQWATKTDKDATFHYWMWSKPGRYELFFPVARHDDSGPHSRAWQMLIEEAVAIILQTLPACLLTQHYLNEGDLHAPHRRGLNTRLPIDQELCCPIRGMVFRPEEVDRVMFYRERRASTEDGIVLYCLYHGRIRQEGSEYPEQVYVRCLNCHKRRLDYCPLFETETGKYVRRSLFCRHCSARESNTSNGFVVTRHEGRPSGDSRHLQSVHLSEVAKNLGRLL
ncbi:hypothetical protein JX266_006471 [Neoarthrinium moseri]|nr:hypothetical protein JX266_006471 [Neoarthrinium moseri]